MMPLLPPRKNLPGSSMLKSNRLLIFLGWMIFFISCGGKHKADPGKTYFDKASEYNAYITVRFDEVNRLWNACLSVMDDSTLIYKQLDTLRETSHQSMLDMNNLADFKLILGRHSREVGFIAKRKRHAHFC